MKYIVYILIVFYIVKFNMFRNIKIIGIKEVVSFFIFNFLEKVIKFLIKEIDCCWKMLRGIVGFGVLRCRLRGRRRGARVRVDFKFE